ncbi:MAG: hypothetical protein AB7S74_18715 [Hyphomicrobium sp.]
MTANSGIVVWDKTAASNSGADVSAPWPEGMAPSQVNDSARGGMASTAKWRDDNSGSLQTAGSSTAYTLTTNQNFAGKDSSFVADYTVAFQIDEDCGTPVTLNVDSLGAKPLRSAAGVELVAGALKAGGIYSATYKTSNSGEWILQNVTPTILADSQVATAKIAGAAVTNAKLANMANATIKGRATSGSGAPEDLTLSQVLDLVGSATRGDILIRGASSWTRLAIGSSGAVIVSNGTDPSWGAQNYTKLATVTASSQSAVSFTSLIDSTYRAYVFEVDNLLPTTNTVSLLCEVSDDAGSSWKSTGYAGVTFVSNNSGGSAAVPAGSNIQISQTGDVSNTPGYGVTGSLTLRTPSSSLRKILNGQFGYRNSASGIGQVQVGGYWDGWAALTGIRFRFSSGNVASGIVTMYGIK